MKTPLAFVLVVASLAGCCKDCLRKPAAGPKVEEYPISGSPTASGSLPKTIR